ncbi:hypothetical protein SAMN04515656_10143 [Eubacterium aggregans]|uniref:DUF3784 domain-containing protein n=2 Tax=Eubacterium aggregans TaxID=81409 RepID=A0A1H3WR54_9FIRM|nr:hypothetical protein SAMN04515656_10143 [Eubacterium aggregans]
MLVFILILMLSLSALFFFLGYRLWVKGQITIIHDYHYTRVKESDKKSYTKGMGLALWIMGLGIGAGGIFSVCDRLSVGWIPLIVGIIGGLAVMVYAQLKYNHGIF